MQVDPDVLFSGARTPFVVENGIYFYGWNEDTARWERLPGLGQRVRPVEHGETLVGDDYFDPNQVGGTLCTESRGFRVPVALASEPGARDYFGGPPMVEFATGGPGGVVAWLGLTGNGVQVWVRHPGEPARLLWWQDQVRPLGLQSYEAPLQFSPDGQQVAVSFELPYAVLNALPPEQWNHPYFIVVLDAVTGRELHRIGGRMHLQGSAAWSHDGQRLVADRRVVEVASGQVQPFPVDLPVTGRRLEILGWGDPGWVMYAQEPGKTVTVTMFHLETGQTKMIARASAAATSKSDVRVWMALMPEGYWTDFHARFGAVMRRSMFGQGRVPRPRPAPAWSPAWEEFRAALTDSPLPDRAPEVARAWTVGLKADFARARNVRVDPRTLMPPWRSVFGIIHPEQDKVREAVERAGRRMIRLHEQGTEYPERAELPNDSELPVRWAGVQNSPDARVVAVNVDINEYIPTVLRVALHIMVNELNKSRLRGVRLVPCDHTGTPVPDDPASPETQRSTR